MLKDSTVLTPEYEDTAHSIEGSDAVIDENLTPEEAEIFRLAAEYQNSRIAAIRETYNSKFAGVRNAFRTSKLDSTKERWMGRGAKTTFRTGTAAIFNLSHEVMSFVPVTIPGVLVASAATGAMGAGYDNFINKQTTHKVWGYGAVRDFLTAKETLEPERLKGKRLEYKSLIGRIESGEYETKPEIEADLAEIRKLIKSFDLGMIYNAKSEVEIRISTEKGAEKRGWVQVDGLEGLSYLQAKQTELTRFLVGFETDSDVKNKILLSLFPERITKEKDKLIGDVVRDSIRDLRRDIVRKQRAMWATETVFSTGLTLVGGALVGKWAERSFNWGSEAAKTLKSTLDVYFEFNKEIYLADPTKFKTTLSLVAETHIADQLDLVMGNYSDELSIAEMDLKSFAQANNLTEGVEFRQLFEEKYLDTATGEDISRLVRDAGNADLDSAEGAMEIIKHSGLDRFAIDTEAEMPLGEVFEQKSVLGNEDFIALMKRNPRVFGDLDGKYIGEVKYYDAISRMPKEDFDKYMSSMSELNTQTYTSDEAILKLRNVAGEVGVRYEERTVEIPVFSSYRVESGDTFYGILDKNNISLNSNESVKFVSDNREALINSASRFGNDQEMEQLLARIDSGEVTSLSDDYALSSKALHWINTGDEFKLQTGVQTRVEKIAVGSDPEWLKPRVESIQVPGIEPASVPESVVDRKQAILDIRAQSVPDKISIDSIGLSADVNEVNNLDSVNYPYISRTFAGHVVDSGSLGYEDWPNKNMIIGGHVSFQGNPAVFFNLNKVQIGEMVKITDLSGRESVYRVSRTFMSDETKIGSDVSLQSDKDILTLITCQYGQNENKIVVVAEKVANIDQAMADQEKLGQLRTEIANIKSAAKMSFAEVIDFNAARGKRAEDLKKLRESILAKAA